MDISELKSNTPVSVQSHDVVDPNVAKMRGKNIEGNELRDFGDGKKEFDPVANGFMPQQVETGQDDIDIALGEQFDNAMERKKAELRAFNEAIDAAGGELTEEEFREMQGEGFITQHLKDGAADEAAEAGNEKIKGNTNIVSEPAMSSTKTAEELENEALERELAGDDETVVSYPNIETITVDESDIVEPEKPLQPLVEKPATVMNEFKSVSDSEPTKNETTSDSKISKEDADLAALEDDTQVPDDFTDRLKAAVKKVMLPRTKVIDISSFTISKTPAAVSSTINKSIGTATVSWPLMNSKFPVKMRSFTATELSTLSRHNDSNNVREMYRMIYDHIEAPKGNSFVQWAKCTSLRDLNHLWMGVYAASYTRSNYLPFSCGKCNNVMVTPDVPIMDMVAFSNDESKAEFERIRSLAISDKMANLTVAEVAPINSVYAVAIKDASLYESLFLPTVLDNKFRSDYEDVINLIPYIDGFYVIDAEMQQLRPIDIKEFANNEVKTAKAKIIQMAKIIRSLTSDEFNILQGYIAQFTDMEDGVTYQLPATQCDDCAAEIPAEANMAAQLVFTRHQLAIYGVL